MSNSTPRLDCLAEQPIRLLKRDATLLFAALLRKTKPHLHIVMAEPRFNLRLSPAGLYLEGGLSEYNPQVPWISYQFSSFEHYSQLPLPFAAWHRDASKPMSCANEPRGCTSHGSAALLELLGTSSESCNPKPENRTGNLKTVVSRKADVMQTSVDRFLDRLGHCSTRSSKHAAPEGYDGYDRMVRMLFGML